MKVRIETNGDINIIGPISQPEMFRLMATVAALKLETLGLHHSQGSVYAHVKKEFGLKGTKKSVYEQFKNIVDQIKEAYKN